MLAKILPASERTERVRHLWSSLSLKTVFKVYPDVRSRRFNDKVFSLKTQRNEDMYGNAKECLV